MSPNRIWQTKYGKLERFYWSKKFVFYLDNQLIDNFYAMRLIAETDQPNEKGSGE